MVKTGRSTIYYECWSSASEHWKTFAYSFEDKTIKQHRERWKILKRHFSRQNGSRYLGSMFKVYT